jgi:hypothetical protein
MVALLLLLGLGATAIPDRSGPIVEAGLFAATPSVLGTGQLLGPSVDLWFDMPIRLGVRARLGTVGEDDPVWHIEHTELRVSALLALVHTIGRGEVSLGLSLGGVALHEVRTRHQAERLASAGLDPETTAWSIGPQGAIEAGVRVFVFEGFGVSIDGGPSLGVVPMSGGTATHVGFAAALSVAYAF